jgi:hypothetical protein
VRAGTLAIVAAAILGAGVATLWLAATEGEANIRMVEELLAQPAAHRHDSYVLMGIPQPERVPLTGPNGTLLAPNPAFNATTVATTAWTRDGTIHYSTHILTPRERDGRLHWSFRNETRLLPADPEPAWEPVTAEWVLGAPGEAFPVTAFRDGERQRVWAWYPKAPENPMQPKPSQFTGRVLDALPDGTPLPPGAVLYRVEEFTAGCSSKFLPPELQDQATG